MKYPPTFLIFLHSLHEPQLEEKTKTLQGLPDGSVRILISQKVTDPVYGFFHLFLKQGVVPKQHMLGTSYQTRNIRNW